MGPANEQNRRERDKGFLLKCCSIQFMISIFPQFGISSRPTSPAAASTSPGTGPRRPGGGSRTSRYCISTTRHFPHLEEAMA